MTGRGLPRAAPARPALRQELGFCRAADGVQIAVAHAGRGPPLVRAAHWLSHVDYDLQSPVWRPWVQALAERHSFIRYDQRGCGLSDRDVQDFTLEAWVNDLEAVAETLPPDPFPLIGMSQGGAVAIAFALRHPERVSRLVLIGAYARGGLRRGGTEEERIEAETLINLVRLGWGGWNPAFRRVFTSRFIPGGSDEQLAWWSDLERVSATPEVAARTLAAFQRIDVTELARQVEHPTLVLHATGDACVPFEEGRLLAQLIPGARFVPLASGNHVLLPTEPAWETFLSELRAFLAADRPALAAPVAQGLTRAEADVLSLMAEGYDNRNIAARLDKSEKTVRNQVSLVLGKLGVRTRAEAIVAALRGSQGAQGRF